jgi:apolipoprotein N-acyltransferase
MSPDEQSITMRLNTLSTRRFLNTLRTSELRYDRRITWATLSGFLYALGFCGFDIHPLAWFCLVGTLAAIDHPKINPRHAFMLAWWSGFVAHLTVYTWVVALLERFAQLPWSIAVLGYLLLCLAQSLLFGAWGLVVHQSVHRLKYSIVWLAPVAMVCAEWLVPALFPSYLGNALYRQLPLIQSLDLWGPLGLTFLLTFSSSLIYATIKTLIQHSKVIPILFAWLVFAGLLGANIIYGYTSLARMDDSIAHAKKQVTIGVVQANMHLSDPTNDIPPHLALYQYKMGSLEMERQGADLIIWPESAYPYHLSSQSHIFRNSIHAPLRTPLLFGATRVEPTKRGQHSFERYNSAFLLNAKGEVHDIYNKNLLLAFGEYIPILSSFEFFDFIMPPNFFFSAGDSPKSMELAGVRYGVSICYEALMPRFIRQLMADKPHILINLTNDAWFGDTHEPLLHLALASFRAVENRRFMVRSTNTGITAFISPTGQILEPTQTYTKANRIMQVSALEDMTVYARFGDWLAYLCVFLLLFIWRHHIIALVTALNMPRLRTRTWEVHEEETS